MANEKTCFIIMPVTTPEAHLERYSDGPEHFRHVLECLLAPAAEEAGFDVVRPIAKGAVVIQAEIIKNLESADMVLCDMSCLNPNVLFEFGIRTALNKPVCVVRDELTDILPFDTAALNHHTYRSGLESWEIHRPDKSSDGASEAGCLEKRRQQPALEELRAENGGTPSDRHSRGGRPPEVPHVADGVTAAEHHGSALGSGSDGTGDGDSADAAVTAGGSGSLCGDQDSGASGGIWCPFGGCALPASAVRSRACEGAERHAAQVRPRRLRT